VGLFDFPSGGGGLIADLAAGAGQVVMAMQQKRVVRKQGQAMRRSSRELEQAPGWGGYRPQAAYNRGFNALNLAGAPVPYGGGGGGVSIPRGGSLGGLADVIGTVGRILTTRIPGMEAGGPGQYGLPYDDEYYDPTPGPWAGDDPRSQDAYRRRAPSAPSIIRATDAQGRCIEYRKRGRAIITTDELAIVKRAGNTLATLRAALDGKKAPKRRRACGRKKKKKGCRRRGTLSPAQLAAGFGGRAYRR